MKRDRLYCELQSKLCLLHPAVAQTHQVQCLGFGFCISLLPMGRWSSSGTLPTHPLLPVILTPPVTNPLNFCTPTSLF